MGLLSNLRSKSSSGPAIPPALRERLQTADGLLRPAEREHRAERSRGEGDRFASSALGAVVRDMDDAQQRAAALWAHQQLCVASHAYDAWPAMKVIGSVGRRKLAWTALEVGWALELALSAGRETWDLTDRLRLPVFAAERLPRQELTAIEQPLRRTRLWISRSSYLPPAERQRTVRRLEALLAGPDAVVTELPPSLLHDGDTLGPALRADLGGQLDVPGVIALLVHATTAGGPNPSGRWTKQGAALLQAADGGVELTRAILSRALEHRETLQQQRWEGLDEVFDVYFWVHESTASVLRGLALLAGQLDEPWVTPLLGDLALYAGGGCGGSASSPRDIVVANAAISALAQRADAVPYLARAQARLKHRGVLKYVVKGLETAAANSGLTRSELLESAVPTHGLHPRGERHESVGEHIAVLAVTSPGVVSLSFTTSSGKALAGVPSAVKEQHAHELSALRAEVEEIKKTLITERLRVEALLAQDRTWTFDDWVRLYRDHPVLGRLVRGLLWRAGDGAEWTTGRLLDDGTLTALDGAALPTGEGVRLWHPAQASVEEVRAWRSCCWTPACGSPSSRRSARSTCSRRPSSRPVITATGSPRTSCAPRRRKRSCAPAAGPATASGTTTAAPRATSPGSSATTGGPSSASI